MKVSLVDVDGHNFPNLALMKLAAWHKSQGDMVDWYMPLFSNPDRIYASKVFTFTRDYFDYAPNDPEPIKGGTGYGLYSELPPEVEAIRPDYSMYPQIRRWEIETVNEIRPDDVMRTIMYYQNKTITIPVKYSPETARWLRYMVHKRYTPVYYRKFARKVKRMRQK